LSSIFCEREFQHNNSFGEGIETFSLQQLNKRRVYVERFRRSSEGGGERPILSEERSSSCLSEEKGNLIRHGNKFQSHGKRRVLQIWNKGGGKVIPESF